MRWFVEINSLGKPEQKAVRSCLEASQWSVAYQEIRRSSGQDDSLGYLSIELLDDGVRIVDPKSRQRYEIRRAPDDAAVTVANTENTVTTASERVSERPSEPKPLSQPPAHMPSATPLARPYSRAPSVPPPTTQPRIPSVPPQAPPHVKTPSVPPPAPAVPQPIPTPPPPAGLAPIPNEPYQVLARREEQPSKTSPLTYREYAYAIAEGSTEKEAETFIFQRFEEIKDELASTRSAKLVNLAVFDHAFSDRPKRPPLVTLVWKDWKGNPEIRYTSRPGVSIPPPSLGRPSSQPAAEPPSVASNPPQPIETPSAVSSLPKELPSSVPPAAPSHEKEVSTAATDDQPARSRVADSSSPSSDSSHYTPASTPVAKRQRRSDAPQPATASSGQAAEKAQPVSRSEKVPPSPLSDRQARKSSQSGEIIADIFESMHDLYFLRDAYEGADFVIALALDKMRCTLGMAQLYDINRREFVVAHVVGPNAQDTLGHRTSEHDPLLVEIMNRRLPFIMQGTDPRIDRGRWKQLGGSPHSILACSVAQGGRFLGILEVAHEDRKKTFRKADVDAMAYIAQSFAEFIAKIGLQFGSVTPFNPK